MRECGGEGAADAPRFRKSMRSANITYRNGWFFVTWQTGYNKLIFGAVIGDRCELNELGRRVEECWREVFLLGDSPCCLSEACEESEALPVSRL